MRRAALAPLSFSFAARSIAILFRVRLATSTTIPIRSDYLPRHSLIFCRGENFVYALLHDVVAALADKVDLGPSVADHLREDQIF